MPTAAPPENTRRTFTIKVSPNSTSVWNARTSLNFEELHKKVFNCELSQEYKKAQPPNRVEKFKHKRMSGQPDHKRNKV